MSPHLLKLRVRRFWRRWLALGFGSVRWTSQLFEANLFARFARLQRVWRFVVIFLLAWLLLGGALLAQIINLRTYYQLWEPVPGGRFTEGVAGSFTTANPLYAVSDVDTTVSRLLFAGLLRYDGQNHLTGDLAESWSADPSGRVYTVRLRPNLTWDDGRPVTADDVVYTYRTIQNPDAGSPLLSSWQGVTVAAVDPRVITFTLPNPLSSFPTSLTNGIIPQHILGSINPVDLRSVSFDTANPVGDGPFEWGSIGVSGIADTTEAQISLVPFDHYWAGAPKLTNLTIHAFANTDAMVRAYQSQQLTAMAGLDTLPEELRHDRTSTVYSLPLTAGVYVFFKTTGPILSDVRVRRGLVAAADRPAIIKSLGYNPTPVDEPLLKDQLGYDATYAQATNASDQAKTELDSAGWQVGAHGLRVKNGQTLSFAVWAVDNSESRQVVGMLIKQWRAVGADVQASFQAPADFQANIVTQRDYQAVLDGISIGTDPDVFVYWDSSQNDQRSETQLNFSAYKSSAADIALEAGRTRLDPVLRAVKYRAFLQAWKQDAPALGLYQPRFLYVSHVPIYGLSAQAPINDDADRFRNVQNWMINLGWVTRE